MSTPVDRWPFSRHLVRPASWNTANKVRGINVLEASDPGVTMWTLLMHNAAWFLAAAEDSNDPGEQRHTTAEAIDVLLTITITTPSLYDIDDDVREFLEQDIERHLEVARNSQDNAEIIASARKVLIALADIFGLTFRHECDLAGPPIR